MGGGGVRKLYGVQQGRGYENDFLNVSNLEVNNWQYVSLFKMLMEFNKNQQHIILHSLKSSTHNSQMINNLQMKSF